MAIKGRLKNARNQLRGMEVRVRKGEDVELEEVQYTLNEVLAALEELEE